MKNHQQGAVTPRASQEETDAEAFTQSVCGQTHVLMQLSISWWFSRCAIDPVGFCLMVVRVEPAESNVHLVQKTCSETSF